MGHVATLGSNVVETTSGTGTITLTAGAAVGETVTVGVVWESGAGAIPAISSVTDDRGNTYAVDKDAGGAGNNTVALAICRGRVTTALQVGDTITVTLGTTRIRWALQADSFDDVAAVSPLDRTAANNNPGSASALSSGTTAATTEANELVVAAFGFASGAGQTASLDPGWSGAAQVETNAGSADRALQVIWKYVSSTGAQQGTVTLSSSSTYAGAVVTYKLDTVATPKAGSDSAALTEGPADLSVSGEYSDTATLIEAAATEVTASGSDTASLAESATRVVMGELSWRFAIDWNNDGDFDGTGEDVTDRVLASGGFNTSYGRDQARALAPPAAGRAAFTLNNQSGDYSPDRADSPLADDLLPARPIQATVDLNGETHVLFRGHLDDYEVKVERNRHTVDATALDALADLQGVDVSTPLHQGVRTGDAIGYLLDAVGWPADKRDLDPGATFIRWWWLHEDDAWNALLELVASEGPGALVHADESGRIVFRDRHHRLLNEGSTTGQAVITDGTDGWEPAFSAITYNHGWRDIVNTVTFSVEERDPSPSPETVWESEDVRSVPALSTISVEIQANEPVVNPTVTYTSTGGSVTATLTQDTARNLTLEFTAGVSAASVSDVVVSGQLLTTQRSYTITQEDAASIGKYGARSPGSSVNAPWAGVHDALAIAELLVGARSERLPTVQITMRGARINDRLVEQVGRDLSDRVHVTEQVTGVDTDFYLEQISHRVLPGGFLETEFGLEKAATQVDDVFRFDDDDHGFDDGVFGSTGLDDPDNLFIFDQDGHGFDDGVFAT